MSEREEYRTKLKRMVFAGGVIPLATELPEWTEEWQPFGENGDMMREVKGIESDASMYLYKAVSTSEFPVHWHKNDEMFMLIYGSMTMNFEDRPSVLMRPGDSVFIPREELHSCKFHEDSFIVLAYVPAFDEGLWQGLQKINQKLR